jgi:hypothetical protein
MVQGRPDEAPRPPLQPDGCTAAAPKPFSGAGASTADAQHPLSGASSALTPAVGAAPLDARGAGPLVLYGDKSTEGLNSGPRSPCPNATRNLRVRTPDGGWMALRCKRRSCPYCGRLADYELLQCLLIDARVQLPSIVVTLTTVAPYREDRCRRLAETYRNASTQLWRSLRSEFGRGVEYFGSMEFTTGQAATSGGDRRLHGHYLVKGMDPAMCPAAQRSARKVWTRATGAWNVEVAALATAGGIVGYLALHHRKREQLPPASWRGRTERPSQGYWHRPIEEIRGQARREQGIRRAEWWLRKEGATAEQARLLAPLEVDQRAAEWADHPHELVVVHEGRNGAALPTPAAIR